MKTLNSIATELRNTASLVGGNHLSPKEAEQKLNSLAEEIDEINVNFLELTDSIKKLVGLDENYLLMVKRERDIKERSPGN